MKIRADVNMRHYFKSVLIGLGVFGFGLWSMYDAFIGFPNQRVRAHKYEELSKLDNFYDEWVDHARSQNWPLQDPGEPKSDLDIYFNYVMAAICTPFGIWLLVGVVRARGRWIEADDSGVRASWGPEFTYDSVTQLEKRKWQKKGIARVYFESGDQKGKFVIDDFKFKRQPTDEILAQLESKIQLDLITGGPPELTEQELEPQDEAAEPAQ